MARTVLDAALLHEAIGGHDPLDSTSIDAPVPVLAECARRGAEGDLSGLTVGVVRELGGEGHTDGYEQGVLARVAEAVALLEGMGAEVREVSCPAFDLALAAYYLIAPSEASSNLARFDGVRLRAARRRRRRRATSTRSWRSPASRASGPRSSAGSSSAPTRCPAATTRPTTARRRRCAR